MKSSHFVNVDYAIPRPFGLVPTLTARVLGIFWIGIALAIISYFKIVRIGCIPFVWVKRGAFVRRIRVIVRHAAIFCCHVQHAVGKGYVVGNLLTESELAQFVFQYTKPVLPVRICNLD